MEKRRKYQSDNTCSLPASWVGAFLPLKKKRLACQGKTFYVYDRTTEEDVSPAYGATMRIDVDLEEMVCLADNMLAMHGTMNEKKAT